MDEFKPEDELKPDPSDRRTGRSRQSSERSERTERGEPQINFDDIELDEVKEEDDDATVEDEYDDEYTDDVELDSDYDDTDDDLSDLVILDEEDLN